MSTQSTRAWVHDGVRQIEYLRAGAGPTVIMLVNGSAGEAAQARLFAELTRTCRVIQPDNGHSAGDLSEWLAGFLDALGVARVSVVASDELALSALRFALTEADRVERIALLNYGAAGLDDHVLSDVLAHRRQPLLVLSADATGTLDQLDKLSEFLTQQALAEN